MIRIILLQFGSNSSLVLEYGWDEPEKITPKTETETCDSTNNDNQDASVNNTSNPTPGPSTEDDLLKKPVEEGSNLKATLERLLSIAKLHYRKNIVHCPCGHVCGNSKSNTTIRSKPVSKTNKVGEKNCSDNGDVCRCYFLSKIYNNQSFIFILEINFRFW